MKEQEEIPYRDWLITSKPEYTLYRQSIKKEHKIQGRDTYFKFIQTYFDTVAEATTEYRGGVCLKNFMYLFLFQIPKKVNYRILGKPVFNFHSDHKVYVVSIQFPARFRHWTLKKRSFTMKHKQTLKTNIKRGEKYKAFFKTLRKGNFI